MTGSHRLASVLALYQTVYDKTESASCKVGLALSMIFPDTCRLNIAPFSPAQVRLHCVQLGYLPAATKSNKCREDCNGAENPLERQYDDDSKL